MTMTFHSNLAVALPDHPVHLEDTRDLLLARQDLLDHPAVWPLLAQPATTGHIVHLETVSLLLDHHLSTPNHGTWEHNHHATWKSLTAVATNTRRGTTAWQISS